MADPQRKAPRWARKLRFEADDAFKGDVVDLSAVGMRVRVKKEAVSPGPQLLPGTLTFENGLHVRIKVRVVRVDGPEVGLEIAEADRAFYDALPKLRKDSGETPVAK